MNNYEIMLKESEITRRIVVLLNNSVIQQDTIYPQIIGLDISSGDLIRLISEKSRKNDNFQHIGYLDVIKVTIGKANNDKIFNTFKMKGLPTVLGKTDLDKFITKYKKITGKTINKEFDDVFCLGKITDCNEFYMLVRFSHTKIKSYTKEGKPLKFQIKMGDCFLDILDKVYAKPRYNNCIFKGLCVVSAKRNFDNRFIYKAEKMLGFALPAEKFKTISKETEEATGTHINYVSRNVLIPNVEEYCDDSYFYEWYGYDEDDVFTRMEHGFTEYDSYEEEYMDVPQLIDGEIYYDIDDVFSYEAEVPVRTRATNWGYNVLDMSDDRFALDFSTWRRNY